jgi:hypothetical protein
MKRIQVNKAIKKLKYKSKDKNHFLQVNLCYYQNKIRYYKIIEILTSKEDFQILL